MTMAGVLAASAPSDWLPLAPESTLNLQPEPGRVVIPLAPQRGVLRVWSVAASREYWV